MKDIHLQTLGQGTDDPNFPGITYRRGTSGVPTPVLRGTGIRVQTIVGASLHWKINPAQIADEYDLSKSQVQEALSFYKSHRAEIDTAIATEEDDEEISQ
jgi:uncharacterized protein (DUF433 family)